MYLVQLVDFVTIVSACNGELMNNSFAFAVKNAMFSEASNSYTCSSTKGICKTSYCNVEFTQGSVTSYKDVP